MNQEAISEMCNICSIFSGANLWKRWRNKYRFVYKKQMKVRWLFLILISFNLTSSKMDQIVKKKKEEKL